MDNERTLRQRAASLNTRVTAKALQASTLCRLIAAHHREHGKHRREDVLLLQQSVDDLRTLRVQQLRLQADMLERKITAPFDTKNIPNTLPEDL